MPPESASIRPFAWAWLAYAILIFLLALNFWIPSGLYKDFDFRGMYAAGVLARTDSSHLYDLSRQKQVQDSLVGNLDQSYPYGHLAYDALLYVPLSLLNYRNAYLSVVLCNAILVVLCFLAGRKEFSETIPLWQPRAGFIFFTFMPTTITLAQGQDSLLLLLTLCLTWKLLDRSQNFAAGLVLANLLLKPHLALLVALFVAVRYGWRFVAGFLAGSAAVAAICLPFWLHGGWRAWLGVLSSESLVSGHSHAQDAVIGIYSLPNLRGAFLLLLGTVLSSRVLFGVVCLGSLILLAWGLVVVRKLRPRNAFGFSIILTVLLSYHLQPHDLAILLLPMVLIGWDATKALARCRDVILGFPIALMIFAPSTPPGAGFTLMSAPLLVSAFFIGRGAAEASGGGGRGGVEKWFREEPSGSKKSPSGVPGHFASRFPGAATPEPQ
ncbi:MAG: glycosyltransferase family 87 protein [Terracidiphilus sp.]